MKRLLYLLTLLLLPCLTWAQFADDPAEPGNKYRLTLTVFPSDAGRTYGAGSYNKGTKVEVYTYANEGYTFSCWKKGDEVVSTSSSFNYLMTNAATTLIAVYTKNGEGGSTFEPTDPSEPNSPGSGSQDDKNTYTLTIIKAPEKGGRINQEGSIQMKSGETVYLYATPSTGYEMDGWYNNERLMSIQESYSYTMWNKNDTMVVRFIYKPSDPKEPGHSENKEFIVISSQSELEAYANVEEFPRSVRIMGTGITSLQSLSKMKKINGDLRIENTSLINLEGLDNLSTITGKLVVSGNRRLVAMDGIYSWDNIYYVLIEDNPELTDFCAMTAYAQKDVPAGSIHGNAYNPTFEQISDGFCSKNEDVFKVTETSLNREPNLIHVKVRFTNEPYHYASFSDFVSFASESESLALKSHLLSNLSCDFYFDAPKKEGKYTLKIHNTLGDTKGHALNQNGNSYTDEDADNYSEDFNFGGEELYVVAQAPLTGGALGEASYTDLVFNDYVESVPTSNISLESPSGKVIAITSIEYIDSISPARHRVNYGVLDEDGNYSFSVSTGLSSKNGKSMSYQYQSTIEMPSANFIPASVEPINANWVAGKRQSIKYVVNNVGTKPANGKIVDVIYLSSTETWNSEAIELYRDTISVNVEAQGSYTQTIPVTVPTVVDGKYYLILKTNVTHNVKELSFADNNLSAEGLNVSVEVLTNENNKFTLRRGDSKIFRIQTESDKNVEIIDKYGLANMYMGYFQLPNTKETPNQGSLTIPGADASMKYYVLISNNGKNQTKFQQCELSIRNFELEVGNVGRNTIVKHGTAWVPVEVIGCTDIPTFYLMDSKGTKTECKKVVTKTETSFFAQFDTESLEAGQYALYVESNGMTGLKQNAITVSIEPAQTSIISKLVLPGTSRIGSTITAYIDYYNSGNVDLPAPLFILSGTEGSTYGLPTGGTFTSEAHIIGVNENGVVSALMPGESNRICINITIPNEQISTADYKLKTITEGCDGIDEPFYLQWLDVEPSVVPSCYTAEEWRAYCNRLRNNVGYTWMTFIQALGKAADMLFTEGIIDFNAHFLYSIIKQTDLYLPVLDTQTHTATKRAESKLRDVVSGTIFIWKNSKWNQLVTTEEGLLSELEPHKWKKTDYASLINYGNVNTYIISHGWRDDREGETIEIAKELAKKDPNSNIIGIDWSRLAWSLDPRFTFGLFANKPAVFIPHVADNVIDALCSLYNTNKNYLYIPNLHLIGHSHGAHVCGMIAHKLKFKPKRLTALDASTDMSHMLSYSSNIWDKSDVQFLDYYKSSIMAGTNQFKGHNNFILIESNNGFEFSKSLNVDSETYRHIYSIDWYVKTIRDRLPIGFGLTPDYLRSQWGKGYNEEQYHGVINGTTNHIENFNIRDSLKISSEDWNYTEPWYGKKFYQGLGNDNIFQNAFASTVEYKAKNIQPYRDEKDYIISGTQEKITVTLENRADNATVPLNIRYEAVVPISANTLFITNSEDTTYSIIKNNKGQNQIKTKAELYILGYNSDYCNLSEDKFETDIEFNISTSLWDILAGNNKEEDYIYCNLWFIAACDKEYLLGDWYNSSKSMYYPFSNSEKSFRTIKLAQGELYAQNNVFVKESVKVQNPSLACEAGDDQIIKMKKGEEKTKVKVNGSVKRDNGKTIKFFWKNNDTVFSTDSIGEIELGVGTYSLAFRIEAEDNQKTNTRASTTQSEKMAEDYVTIKVEPYTPGDDDDESTSTAASWDPNEKVGIKGAGSKACVKPGEMMEYSIFFENDAEKAQLAAQTVTVIDTLDVAFDLSTFEFTGSEVSNMVVDIPAGMVETTVLTDMRPNNDLILKTDMKLDIDSRVITVVYSSLDTLTNEPTQDVFAGFLPPNDSTHVGEGHFSYRVKLKDDVADGYVINNQAHIFFDYNDEIATNITSHTIDVMPPYSKMTTLPQTIDIDSILISWSGKDLGSGIKYYDIYYAKDGGDYTVWKSKISDTVAVLYGNVGERYDFFSIAVDSLGLVETMKSNAESSIEFVQGDIVEEKDISLKRGWNWISFNKETDSISDVNKILSSGKWTVNDEVKNQRWADSYSVKQKRWLGTLSNNGGFNNTGMFMINSSIDQDLKNEGSSLDPTNVPINIHEGWNYISYLPIISYPVEIAMANYHATPGDILKSQDAFCVYDSNSGWNGSLETMEPTLGYMLYRQTGNTSFNYPDNNITNKVNSRNIDKNSAPLDNHSYSQNMSIIGQVTGVPILEEDNYLLSYIDNELRGRTTLSNVSPISFITVDGDQNGIIDFKIERNGMIIAESYNNLGFSPNSISGSLELPTEIKFVESTKNENVDIYPHLVTDEINIKMPVSGNNTIAIDIYNMLGSCCISSIDYNSSSNYHKTINCEKLSTGIYLINIKVDGKHLTTTKIVKK